MTHAYTLLVGATVLPGGDAPPCDAIAWAGGTILALGSEPEIRAISRGDSHVLALPGVFVVPAGEPLEVGGPADLVILDGDPRLDASAGARAPRLVARIVGGHLGGAAT